MGYNLLLLLAAAIWGSGFVAQSLGMKDLGPFGFTGARFLVGSASLVPLCLYFYKKGKFAGLTIKDILIAGLPVGCLLFIAISFQQVGLKFTTAGNAGFITSLYVILVPILGIFIKKKTNLNVWVGCFIAIIGLFFVSVSSDSKVNYGDMLQLIGALFWAAHILTIDHFSRKISPILLSFFQFLVCGIIGIIVACSIETITFSNIMISWKPILYSGIMSVGIAYTLQVVAQEKTHPSVAAIILSLEAVFAVIFGVLFLNESITFRMFIGCGLMLIGILLPQINFIQIWKKNKKNLPYKKEKEVG